MYPQGASASGVLDMSGNVWEWCLNKGSAPHSITVDGPSQTRALRGGSFGSTRARAALSFRNDEDPRVAGGGFGFRVGLFPSR